MKTFSLRSVAVLLSDEHVTRLEAYHRTSYAFKKPHVSRFLVVYTELKESIEEQILEINSATKGLQTLKIILDKRARSSNEKPREFARSKNPSTPCRRNSIRSIFLPLLNSMSVASTL